MASFFRPQFYTAPEPNFHGLFRLIDEFDKYATQSGGNGSRHGRQVVTFTPKFDMRESETTYELHGELPGVAKEDLHIEFTDPQTLLIKGKVDRTTTAGTPPTAALIDSKPDDAASIAEPAAVESHKATVEDDPDEKDETSSTHSTPQHTPATTVAEVVKPEQQHQHQHHPAAPRHKYYLVERNIGHFSRAFPFPGRVESAGVKASLENGILTVVVPKAKKHESQRITVD